LHDLFYPDGTKIIPQNIAEFIKPIGLAFWLMDDGYWNQVGRYVVLCTESFTPAEVRLLINALNSKWDLKCYEYKRGDSNPASLGYPKMFTGCNSVKTFFGYRIVIP
jgi:hypothetical protein